MAKQGSNPMKGSARGTGMAKGVLGASKVTGDPRVGAAGRMGIPTTATGKGGARRPLGSDPQHPNRGG